MITLPLVFVAGLLGSAHCIGMCGPFALLIGGGATNWRGRLQRQSVYTLGRVFTYASMGAVAGSAGLYLQRSAPAFINVAAALAIFAGFFLVYQGLLAAGVLGITQGTDTAHGTCFGATFLAKFLRSQTQMGVFLAGLLTGMLPCGLVYGFLALAASSEDLLTGALVMAAFGCGTAPVMIATGFGGGLISVAARRRLLTFAAWCVVITGVLSIGRGAGFLNFPGWFAGSGCPMCHPG